MQKLAKQVFSLLTNCYIATLIALVIGFSAPDDSLMQTISGTIGVYGIILTFGIFCLHLLTLLLFFIFRKK